MGYADGIHLEPFVPKFERLERVRRRLGDNRPVEVTERELELTTVSYADEQFAKMMRDQGAQEEAQRKYDAAKQLAGLNELPDDTVIRFKKHYREVADAGFTYAAIITNDKWYVTGSVRTERLPSINPAAQNNLTFIFTRQDFLIFLMIGTPVEEVEVLAVDEVFRVGNTLQRHKVIEAPGSVKPESRIETEQEFSKRTHPSHTGNIDASLGLREAGRLQVPTAADEVVPADRWKPVSTSEEFE